jgi:lactoylglutathione lyase
LVDDLQRTCAWLESQGVRFMMKPGEGMDGIAFIYDPDGYWIELIQRGLGDPKPQAEAAPAQAQ